MIIELNIEETERLVKVALETEGIVIPADIEKTFVVPYVSNGKLKMRVFVNEERRAMDGDKAADKAPKEAGKK